MSWNYMPIKNIEEYILYEAQESFSICCTCNHKLNIPHLMAWGIKILNREEYGYSFF